MPFQEDETAIHKKTDSVLSDDYQPDVDIDDVEPEVDSLETETADFEVGESDCSGPETGVGKRHATADVEVLNNGEITGDVLCFF